MGDIIDWLMQDEQKDLYEFLVALVINLLSLGLIALLLWPLGSLNLVWSLAKGYGLLWLLIFVTATLLNGIQRFFRMNMYDRANAYIFSTLAVSGLLQIGWSAFAALTVHNLVTGAPIWLAVILYIAGFLSCLIAFWDVSSLYSGQIYRLISLPLTLASFLGFSLWPAAAEGMVGRFFQFF
ncbi:MAG: hypothetical protein U0401_14025 [Anaerolineae bacterium]